MKIAQIAPLYEAVPPQAYGGTERMVYWLTEELIKFGLDVQLFASADSNTSADLIACSEHALRLDGHIKDALALHILMIEELLKHAHEFDVIHSHIDYLPFSQFRNMKLPAVTTMHGRLDLPELTKIFNEFKEQPVISVSHAQRIPLMKANWIANIYHGLPINHYEFVQKPDDYLVFVGRICPEKRVDRAIEIAQRTGLHIKIAAKIDPVDQEYFGRDIECLLQLPGVEYLGEINENEKQELIGKARALLFPIDWPEPFGLVMIEAMACGTPVIAYRKGSVPEIILHGLNGFICHDIDSAIDSVNHLNEIRREECRRIFEERFTSKRMAEDYLRVYQKLMEERGKQKVFSFISRN